MAEEQEGISGSILGKYYTRLTIGKYKRPKPFASPKFDKTLVVLLPLPNELRDDTTVSYTNVNLETVGDIVNGNIGSGIGSAILRNSGAMVMGVGSLAGNAFAAIGGALGGDAGEKLAGGAASAVGSIFNAEQISSAVQQSAGLAPNPNPSVTFQGPVLRDFSYSWAFYPKSADESRKLQSLIKVLKRSALPRHTVKDSAAILDYPDMCQINFFPWDKEGVGDWGWSDKSIIRYKKCVMQNINVNYNPFGTPAFFEDTNLPVSYQITISFKEIEYLLSEDWKNTEYGPLDTSGRYDINEATASAATALAITSVAAIAPGLALGTTLGASVGADLVKELVTQ